MIPQEFDEIAALKGFVRVLKPLLSDYLSVMKVQLVDNSWAEITPPQPAIYLSHPEQPSADYPRVIITYNGDSNSSPVSYDKGLIEITDPNNPPALITVPYSSTYLTWVCTITCDSGLNDEVLRGERLSASYILRKLRDRLNWQSVRKSINEEMCSSVMSIAEITPTYSLEDTNYHNSSIMTLTFDTVSTVYEIDGGCFDTIEYQGLLHRTLNDNDPLIINNTVGPVPAP